MDRRLRALRGLRKRENRALGARPMGRVVAENVKKPLANEILFGKLVHGGLARIDVKDDAITIECEGNPEPAGDDAN